MFFSEDFAPEHRLEALAAEGLLPTAAGELPLLSPEYLQVEPAAVWEWRRFFQELRVDRRLADEGLRERFAAQVAERVVLRDERRRGCEPVRVAWTEERGDDFESGGWRIEVKGRSGPEPAIDPIEEKGPVGGGAGPR